MEPNDREAAQDTTGWSSGIEWFLGLLVACLLAVMAVPGVRTAREPEPADTAVRGIEDLLVLARDEAMQTGERHLVFFEIDPRGEPVVSPDGAPVMALLIRDRDGDWLPSESEYVASVAKTTASRIDWGSDRATSPAPGDRAEELVGPWTFARSDGASGARWLLFDSDGAPHAFPSADGGSGAAGSGAGTVYLRDPMRDYAVVVSPWGDVELQIWEDGARDWRRTASR